MWLRRLNLNHLNLKKLYLTIIIMLFLMMVLMQMLNTQILHAHREHTKLLALTGRQKLLSQQMVKLALLTERGQGDFQSELHQIALLSNEWSQAHFNLKFGNDHWKMNPPDNEKIDDLILRLQPHKDGISDAINELLMVAPVDELRSEAIEKIRIHEDPFLLLMDELTITYQLETEKSMELLSNLKFFILLFSLLALLILFLLYSKIQMRDEYAYSNQGSVGKKEFFSGALADVFMKSQAPKSEQRLEKESNRPDISVQKQVLQPNASTDIHQRVRVLMIADESLPADYIAWFLNKWGVDFSIVKNKYLAQAEAHAQAFDMVLMSQSQSLEYDGDYFFTKEGKTFKMPIVTLDASDIMEVHAQIYKEDSAEFDAKTLSPGNLYRKIERHISRNKRSV